MRNRYTPRSFVVLAFRNKLEDRKVDGRVNRNLTSFRPHLPPKLLFPLRRSLPHLIHPSLDRLYSPPQTASRSNQPFCHSTPSGQTDSPTDRQTDWRQVCTKSRLRLIMRATWLKVQAAQPMSNSDAWFNKELMQISLHDFCILITV